MSRRKISVEDLHRFKFVSDSQVSPDGGKIAFVPSSIDREEDHRCPMDQAEQWFTALKLRGVPTELVRFPDENHDLSRSGKPKHREERLKHMLRWFDEHLKKERNHEATAGMT